jgi:GxxExxY protein
MDEGMRVAEPVGPGYNFEPVSQRVIGAAIEVHKRLGPGFREVVYEKALHIEFQKRNIAYQTKVVIPVHYEGIQVGDHELDLLVEKSLVVELKAVSSFHELHTGQLLAHLRAADVRVGLLFNFGEVPLGIKRIVNRYNP